MPEVNVPQQQQPMELAPADPAVVTQQPVRVILPVISALYFYAMPLT